MGTKFKISSCNSKVKTSPTRIGTNFLLPFVAETLVLVVFDMAEIFKDYIKKRLTFYF
ncbi:hypothetical protein [Clostridium ihumii]|uniref:hypothetical protein n=1 Tax=Clostridium ihumii TaxID=1470356 RepID=UPI001315A97A|nr:hypothetical protein [Clostridium ihumii]